MLWFENSLRGVIHIFFTILFFYFSVNFTINKLDLFKNILPSNWGGWIVGFLIVAYFSLLIYIAYELGKKIAYTIIKD